MDPIMAQALTIIRDDFSDLLQALDREWLPMLGRGEVSKMLVCEQVEYCAAGIHKKLLKLTRAPIGSSSPDAAGPPSGGSSAPAPASGPETQAAPSIRGGLGRLGQKAQS